MMVARHGVVVEVTLHHATQPSPLLRDGQMLAPPQLGLDLAQLCTHPLRDSDASDSEPTPLVPAASCYRRDYLHPPEKRFSQMRHQTGGGFNRWMQQGADGTIRRIAWRGLRWA